MSFVKVHILHCGTCIMDRSVAFKEKTLHPVPYTGWMRPKSAKIEVPISAYLLEHPQGLVLIDTGWNEEMRTNIRGHLGWLQSTMFGATLPNGQAIHEQLSQRGITGSDLEYVILTHLHTDHVSGVRHVADAKKILVSQEEWKDAHKPTRLEYVPSMWKGVNVTPFQSQSIPYGPLKLGLDLFGDGKIYLMHTPGHTAGHLSVMVSTEKGWLLLASDVGYAQRSFDEQILPGVRTNAKHLQVSFDFCSEFVKRDDCYRIIANHCTDVKPETM